MGDALITQVIEQFTMVTRQKLEKEYRLVVGVEKEIENISQTLNYIRDILENAERRQLSDPNVKLWLQNLKDVAYDMDDVICEWKTANRKMELQSTDDDDDDDDDDDKTAQKNKNKKVCFSFRPFSCFDFSRVVYRRDIAITVRNINERLNAITSKGRTFNFNTIDVGGQESQVRPRSTSSVEITDVCGRDEDKTTLVSKLCSESSTQAVKETLQIISIVGLGGIGKTTLAKLIYNCDEVTAQFDQLIWVCISDPYNDDVRIAKAIVEAVEKSAPDVAELETALQLVKNSLNGKKFLLVLDDVGQYHRSSWAKLECVLRKGAPGSRVLVTTRNEGIARMMSSSYIHPLGQLSEKDCWSLFSRIAYNEKTEEEKEELEDIGRKISEKCKGLPLSAYTIGGLMRSKSTAAAWRDVLKSEFWELNGAEDDLSPPLLLSYYDLSSKLRQCFIYCAKFPKYYYIEADNLIKLWMAQGYLTSTDMEATGRSYLDELIMRCFFQNLEKDKQSGTITRFKMHDIVHDFAQYFTKSECFIVKPDGQDQQVHSANANSRHLTLIRGDDTPFPESIKNSEKLHTFWVQSFYDSPPIVSQVDAVSSALFHHMKYLKALDLSHNRLRVLPNDFDKVMNLRYLNLSFNPLERLPESVSDLYNLQTLKLVACNHLTELPYGIGKLENLRHLEIDKTDNLSALPRGISRLRSLRTLSKFVIRGGSSDANEAACKVGDLKDINCIQGRLDIEGLGNVADAGDAKKAQLKKKEDLLMLSMNFRPLVQTDQIMCDVAQALQPHNNLVWLEIKSYGGSQLPNWIVLLSHLKKLVILECQNCEKLPALGELPLLEKLHIQSINNLKCIDHQFLNSNLRNGVEKKIVFPKLKKLEIVKMRSLEEWNLMGLGEISEVDGSNNILKIMPNLHYLKLSECDKLKTLPETLLQRTTPPLRRLHIRNCKILQQRYRRGDEGAKISHIRKIKLW